MASAAANYVNIIDSIIWSIIGIIVQVLASYVARASLPGSHEKIDTARCPRACWAVASHSSSPSQRCMHDVLTRRHIKTNVACGLSIRDDESRITTNLSRFVPRLIVD